MTLRVGHARRKLFIFALLALLFVVVGLWIVWREPHFSEDWWLGILATAFFGLCLVVFCVRVRQSGPVLIIGPDGFYDSRAMDAVIPWGAIRCVSEHHFVFFDGHCLSLGLSEPVRHFINSPFKRLVSFANKPFTSGDVYISLQALDTKPSEIRAAITSYKTIE